MAEQTTPSAADHARSAFRDLAIDRTDYPDTIPGADVQVRSYLAALFDSTHLIELRPIECWTEAGTKRSRLVRGARRWVAARDCAENCNELQSLNANRANIFIGVNPRNSQGGKKDAVSTCRSVWVDFDNMTFLEAKRRWEHLLPPPSMAVSSGHGYHVYWLLCEPYDVRSRPCRERFEAMLKSLYTDLGADATNDVSRILRLPGTWNVKDVRNGKTPEPCMLVYCEPQRRYPISTFKPWFDERSRRLATKGSCRPKVPEYGILPDAPNVAIALRHLDKDVSDRSRRDFAVICELLRLRVDPESIWQLVRERSKFADRGREYFDVTLSNAVRNLNS